MLQLVERGMGEHGLFLSMVVAGAAQVGVLEQRGGGSCGGGVSFEPCGRACEATLLLLRTPSSSALAETASSRAGSRPR